VSLLCFALERPSDGFPILEEWASTARDIYHGGWENHRQPVEIRLTDKAVPGSALPFASLLPSKGFARLSILLFGLVWSYQNKETLSNDQHRDFDRHSGGNGWFGSKPSSFRISKFGLSKGEGFVETVALSPI